MHSSTVSIEETVKARIAKQISSAATLVLENKHCRLASVLGTDVFYLRHVVQYIPLVAEEDYMVFQYWLHALLCCPFSVTKILETQAIKELVVFLISCSSIDAKLSKISAKNLAVLANNIYLEHAEVVYNYEEYTLWGKKVPPVFFFRVLKQLAIVGTIDNTLIAIKIAQRDSTVIKRYKLKIISYQTQKGALGPQKTLCTYRQFLNENDTKLGWTLSKCIYRVIRCVKIHPVLESLLSGLGNIFANEQMWINVATVLSFCALDRINPGDVKELISKMLFYDNEHVHKSASVREAGLFLVWSVIRSGMLIDCLDSVILVALFDTAVQCRRAASTVLLEYIGRNHVDEGCKVLDIINFSNVKRLSFIIMKCIDIVQVMPKLRTRIIAELKATMGHYNREKRTLGPRYLPHLERACPCVFSLQSSAKFHYSVFVYTREFLKLASPCNVCMSSGNAVFGYTFDHNMLKDSDCDDLIGEYMSLADDHPLMMDAKKLEENLLFMMDKNLMPDKLPDVVRKTIPRNMNFAEKVFQGLARKSNRAYIIANTFNEPFSEEVTSRYKSIFENTSLDKKTVVVHALRLSGRANLFLNDIKEGLENYSVDLTGDVSTGLRKECLLAAATLHDKLVFERYFVRFFVDRSKLLRDFLVAQGVRTNTKKENLMFLSRMKVDSGVCAGIYDSKVLEEFMDAYYKKYDELGETSLWGHDKIHFSSALNAYSVLENGLKSELFIGTVCAMKNSDASLFYFLLEKLYAIRRHLHGVAVEFLNVYATSPGRTQYLVLFFVSKILMLENEYPNEDLENRISITSGKMDEAEFVFSRSMCLHVSVANILKVVRSASALKLCENVLKYIHALDIQK